ncbi:GNAT family N-acetyltransferase [Intrasporangium sp.]|uniref:GNAT family N-acetyltransferase n=1 Tax=Intrasporangium sp. TaxID=1925024 RepID=UPI003221C9FD
MATDPRPVLTDGVVTLRPHTRDDLDAMVEQCTDESSLRWTTVPRGYTRDDAVAFVERVMGDWADPHGNRHWAIEPADGPGYAGTIDLRPGESWDCASIGYALHPAARGRGVMSRAVRLVAGFAFDRGPWGRPLARVHWRAIVGNWASRRVAWATGFTFHATLPSVLPDGTDPDGPGLDAWHASLAAGDPLAPRLPWFVPVTLEGAQVRLRAWRDGDGASFAEDRHDPAHWFPQHVLLSADTFGPWLEHRRELMALGQAVEWAIADTRTDRALGQLTIFTRVGELTGDAAEIGYQLVPSARGLGNAQAACRLAIEHAFTPRGRGGLGLRRLTAGTAADNAASNGVLHRVGFVEYGREHATDELANGSFADSLHWELLR